MPTMKIERFVIRNFRKLKRTSIELTNESTIFVGANNSGKTSAMDALIIFLGDKDKNKNRKIRTDDITLCNWEEINKLGRKWATSTDENKKLKLDIWRSNLPSLDVWINVDISQIHQISHLIPTLDWSGGQLGVRIQFEPKNDKTLEKLYTDFRQAKLAADGTVKAANIKETNDKTFSLWPKSMREFLDKKIHDYFGFCCFLLDPDNPDKLPDNQVALENKPFDGLFSIHVINAQREFSDNSSDESNRHILAKQLRDYYDAHLNPSDLPDVKDVAALQAIDEAQNIFDRKLKESFEPALKDLSKMNYPGFYNPEIILTSKLNPVESITHKSGIQFDVPRHKESELKPEQVKLLEESKLEPELLRLPEDYNGLGYRNLISMLFRLVQFRDEWQRKYKASKPESIIEPLQLVLIEEPEAHLHAQAQQVFIKKAYEILRTDISEPDQLTTQLVVSTHSSHIAYETPFTSLRYFKRISPDSEFPIPCAKVVNLSEVFGKDDETLKFATRYLKTTHCDLFFADAAILVEGEAERMLIPHFIEHKYPNLQRSYTTVLAIGGSHAHRLKSLIEALDLRTLVITDLDSIKEGTAVKVRPKRNKKYGTGNTTLKDWHPEISDQDELLDLLAEKKVTANGQIRMAYQCPFKVKFNGKEVEAIPYTFEDALTLTNIKLFNRYKDKTTGMLKKMCLAAGKENFEEACNAMYNALEGVKAKMALDVLFSFDPNKLIIPSYVAEGLQWLEEKFEQNTFPKTNEEEISK